MVDFFTVLSSGLDERDCGMIGLSLFGKSLAKNNPR